MKPWIKAASGKLYVDTSDPAYIDWFKKEIQRITKTKGYQIIRNSTKQE